MTMGHFSLAVYRRVCGFFCICLPWRSWACWTCRWMFSGTLGNVQSVSPNGIFFCPLLSPSLPERPSRVCGVLSGVSHFLPWPLLWICINVILSLLVHTYCWNLPVNFSSRNYCSLQRQKLLFKVTSTFLLTRSTWHAIPASPSFPLLEPRLPLVLLPYL